MRQLKPLSEATLREIAEAIAESTAAGPTPPPTGANNWDQPVRPPTIDPPAATHDPYRGPGLLAVIRAIAGDKAPRVQRDLELAAGDIMLANMYTNFATHADETWNSAVAIMWDGYSPQFAWESVQKGRRGLLNDPSFTLEQLYAAKTVIDGYR